MVTAPREWPTSTTCSSILSSRRDTFSTLSAKVTLAGGVWSLPSPGMSGAQTLWPLGSSNGATFSQHQPPVQAPWTSRNVATRLVPADDGARAFRGHEEVGHQRRAGRHGVLVEIGDAFGGQDLVVDEEVAGAGLGRAIEDGVGRIGHDVGLAAALHAVLAAPDVLRGGGGGGGGRGGTRG